MKLHLVSNDNGDEGVFFASLTDTIYTSTGEQFSHAVTTIGDNFRDAYDDQGDESPFDRRGTHPITTIYTGTLETAWNAVREFHIAFNHPAPDAPTPQHWELAERRAMWIESECHELRVASGDGLDMTTNITEQADAYLDIIYFALGGLVELGIEPSAIFDMVQGANMSKLHPDGKPRYDETGKVVKPDGWQSPDPLIEKHIAGLMK